MTSKREKKMLYSCARSRASRLPLNVFTVLFDLTDRCQINEEPALLQTRCVPMYKAAYLLANRPASNEARCGGQNCRRIHLKTPSGDVSGVLFNCFYGLR